MLWKSNQNQKESDPFRNIFLVEKLNLKPHNPPMLVRTRFQVGVGGLIFLHCRLRLPHRFTPDAAIVVECLS